MIMATRSRNVAHFHLEMIEFVFMKTIYTFNVPWVVDVVWKFSSEIEAADQLISFS